MHCLVALTRRIGVIHEQAERKTGNYSEHRANRDLALPAQSRTALRGSLSSSRSFYGLCTLPTIWCGAHFKRYRLSDTGSHAISRKCRDVHKDLIQGLRKGHETEAPLVIPLDERAVDSHFFGPTLCASRE
jgi:hypothetical protein